MGNTVWGAVCDALSWMCGMKPIKFMSADAPCPPNVSDVRKPVVLPKAGPSGQAARYLTQPSRQEIKVTKAQAITIFRIWESLGGKRTTAEAYAVRDILDAAGFKTDGAKKGGMARKINRFVEKKLEAVCHAVFERNEEDGGGFDSNPIRAYDPHKIHRHIEKMAAARGGCSSSCSSSHAEARADSVSRSGASQVQRQSEKLAIHP